MLLFSLCVVDNNSASPTTTETGKTGCLTLHVFPGMNSSAEQVAAAIRAECRLGPLLDRLRLIGHEGGDSEKSENIFHHITSTLDSICRRPLEVVATVQDTIEVTAADVLAMARDAVQHFLPSQPQETPIPTTNQRNQNENTSSDESSVNGDQASDLDRHQRMLSRREKWLTQRFVALHSRERLQKVQQREQAVAKRESQFANTVSSPDSSGMTMQQVQSILAQQREEAVVHLQALQTSLAEQVSAKFEELESSLSQKVDDCVAEQFTKFRRAHDTTLQPVDDSHRTNEIAALADGFFSRLEQRAGAFVDRLAHKTQQHFNALHDSVKKSQAALYQLYSSDGTTDMLVDSAGNGDLQVRPRDNVSAIHWTPSAATSPNSSFIIERFAPLQTDLPPQLSRAAELHLSPVAMESAPKTAIDLTPLLIEAKQKELRQREAHIQLKERRLLALEELRNENELHFGIEGNNQTDTSSPLTVGNPKTELELHNTPVASSESSLYLLPLRQATEATDEDDSIDRRALSDLISEPNSNYGMVTKIGSDVAAETDRSFDRRAKTKSIGKTSPGFDLTHADVSCTTMHCLSQTAVTHEPMVCVRCCKFVTSAAGQVTQLD